MTGRNVLAALTFGLAIGTRLTSVVLLPALLLLPRPGPERERMAGPVGLGALACAFGALFYVPAWGRYGWHFLSFSDPLGTGSTPLDFLTGYLHLARQPFPPALIVGQATALLWGVPGSVALAAAVVAALVRRPSADVRSAHLAQRVRWAASAAVLAETVLYLRLPHDEGYLIPAVLFALLLLAGAASRTWFRVVCLACLVSPFVLGVDAVPPKKGVEPATRSPLSVTVPAGAYAVAIDPLRGPLLQDHDKRVRAAAIVTRVIAAQPRLPARTLLFAGVLAAELTDRLPQDRRHPWYTDYLLEPDLRRAIAGDTTVYLLPGVRDRTVRLAGYDPAAAGARPLFPGN